MSMKPFQGNDYLLHSDLALSLYEEVAKNEPIFDFHCHLSPADIANDHHFSSITEAWLGKNGAGDHYKWRLLREYGVDESLVTGDGDDYERFLAYAKAMPYFIGNPIYEWTHLELKRFFGIKEVLDEQSAPTIYRLCNEKLKTLGARGMLECSNVKMLFTTDDPADDLHYHRMLAQEGYAIKVLPCWRPDRFLHIGNGPVFDKAMDDLEKAIGRKIESFDEFLSALSNRLDYFARYGCKAADHGLDKLRFQAPNKGIAEGIFQKKRGFAKISEDEIEAYESFLLVYLAKEYRRLGFAQQYHIGALRNVSKKNYALHGPDFGYDSIGDYPIAEKLSALLSCLQEQDALPRTVLYALNEKDYASMLSLMNSFQGLGRGYIQLGAAWWFNDHEEGIRKQIRSLMATGLISTFVGMLTDSRSFLSYPRHEYFRRILCDEIANLVEEGRYPNDTKRLKEIVSNICYHNSVHYFMEGNL